MILTAIRHLNGRSLGLDTSWYLNYGANRKEREQAEIRLTVYRWYMDSIVNNSILAGLLKRL